MTLRPTDVSVLDLLPHQPPFIMVDKLTHYDATSAKTTFVVRDDNLFCINGFMEEAGLIENIAQTCAARTGFKQRLETGKSGETGDCRGEPVCSPNRDAEENSQLLPLRESDTLKKFSHQGTFSILNSQFSIKIGVIAMIQSLEMKRRPAVGEVLETSMVIEDEVFSTTFVRSEVKIGDETIASCRMKLFLTDKTPA